MMRSAVAIALFPPIEHRGANQESEYDRGFAAGRLSAQSAAAETLAGLRVAFEKAQEEAEAAHILIRNDMIEATRRLVIACAPALAARSTLDALTEALSAGDTARGPIIVRISPDIAEAVSALGIDAAIEIDPSLAPGSASVRWRHGGFDSSPMRAIDSVIALIIQYADKGIEP
jgi:flagellar biosynthesis/type III secretory pathway protein FliH